METEAEDAVVLKAMNEALQDEYLAYETYAKVMRTWGEIRPFSNIIRAEERHIAAVSGLFERRNLPVPSSRWSASDVPAFATLRQACAAGVAGEERNIALYDRLLSLELPSDVRIVFERLQWASRENHLPAFRRCLGSGSE